MSDYYRNNDPAGRRIHVSNSVRELFYDGPQTIRQVYDSLRYDAESVRDSILELIENGELFLEARWLYPDGPLKRQIEFEANHATILAELNRHIPYAKET